MFGAARSAGAKVGVHCCGNMDWGLLAGIGPDVISFDAFFFGEKLALYPGPMKNFLEKGGILAWGIVPTDTEKLKVVTVKELDERLDGLKKLYADKGFPAARIENQMLLTPSCGMGTLEPAEGEQVLELLKKIGE